MRTNMITSMSLLAAVGGLSLAAHDIRFSGHEHDGQTRNSARTPNPTIPPPTDADTRQVRRARERAYFKKMQSAR